MTTIAYLLAFASLHLLWRAAAQTSGTFNVLSMNVAGLPAILNGNGEGDKTANTQQIGEDFSNYE